MPNGTRGASRELDGRTMGNEQQHRGESGSTVRVGRISSNLTRVMGVISKPESRGLESAVVTVVRPTATTHMAISNTNCVRGEESENMENIGNLGPNALCRNKPPHAASCIIIICRRSDLYLHVKVCYTLTLSIPLTLKHMR